MRILMVICVLLSLFACSQKAPEFTEAQKDELIKEIEAKMDELIKSAEELNTEALWKYLADGADKNFYMAGMALNKEELISMTQAEYEGFASQRMKIESRTTRMINPDAVLALTLVSATAVDSLGDENMLNITDSFLWEKINGNWQVSHLHESWE